MNTNASEVCTTHARQQAQLGALFVDVREVRDATALAFDAPDVFNLPMSQMMRRWQELPLDRDLVIVCQNGSTSALAAQFLKDHGFTRVNPMRGGILLWLQKAYPVIGQRFNPKE